MNYKKSLFALLAASAAIASTSANAVLITGYDVTNASDSGTGGWSHAYTGTITPTGTSGYSDYSGGSGTMADGINTGTNINTTQLFCENTSCGGTSAIKPTITLFLDGFYSLTSLSIFGGDHSSNTIPGAITGVDVTIGSTTVSIASTGFGVPGSSGQPVNDLVTLTGTGLELLATNQVVLSNFTYLERGSTSLGRFSIAELELDGAAVSVPEPGTAGMLGIGLLSLGLLGLRRRRHTA
jgi:hypothetical protein